MIEKIGFPLVLISMLTFVLVETGILTTGIIITIGINLAMLLVLIQIIAILYGFTKSLAMFNKAQRHPLYSTARTTSIKKED